jgi:hypothetical protein
MGHERAKAELAKIPGMVGEGAGYFERLDTRVERIKAHDGSALLSELRARKVLWHPRRPEFQGRFEVTVAILTRWRGSTTSRAALVIAAVIAVVGAEWIRSRPQSAPWPLHRVATPCSEVGMSFKELLPQNLYFEQMRATSDDAIRVDRNGKKLHLEIYRRGLSDDSVSAEGTLYDLIWSGNQFVVIECTHYVDCSRGRTLKGSCT